MQASGPRRGLGGGGLAQSWPLSGAQCLGPWAGGLALGQPLFEASLTQRLFLPAQSEA